MMQSDSERSGRAWGIIEREKRRDTLIRKASTVAWIVTLALAGIYAISMVAEVVTIVRSFMARRLPVLDILVAVTPLVASLGTLMLLLAVLGTLGVFLRFRTASVNELQLRLAALEDLLIDRANSSR
jgi:hypothetical protein